MLKLLQLLTYSSLILLTACGAQESELNIDLVGAGTITTNSGASCSESCVAKVKINPPFIGNKKVQVDADPAPGFMFLGWNHGSCEDTDTCAIEYSGLCADQLFCSTGLVYFAESIRPVFVDTSMLLDTGWSRSAVCAVFASGELSCWARFNADEVEDVPALNNPQQVAVAGSVACAQVDEGIRCWGHPNLIPGTAPLLYPPLEMEMITARICVVDLEGLKCWGTQGEIETPQVVHPVNLRKRYLETQSWSGEQFCVDDGGEEICW